MLLQFDQKHIHKVNFYPIDNNFTQALLVMLVTNMISGPKKVTSHSNAAENDQPQFFGLLYQPVQCTAVSAISHEQRTLNQDLINTLAQ